METQNITRIRRSTTNPPFYSSLCPQEMSSANKDFCQMPNMPLQGFGQPTQMYANSNNIWNPSFNDNSFSYSSNNHTLPEQLSHQQVTSPEQTEILMNKLNHLSSNTSNATRFQNNHHNIQRRPSVPYNDENVFHLPLELQGGLSNINSRRPSFTADQTLTSNSNDIGRLNLSTRNNLEIYAHSNNFKNNFNAFMDFNGGGGAYNQFDSFRYSTDLLNDFRSRRPSMQINPQTAMPLMSKNFSQTNDGNTRGIFFNEGLRPIDNGLLLNQENRIVASSELRAEYLKSSNYFAFESAESLYEFMKVEASDNQHLSRVILNLKKLNNIFNLPNRVMLALTKSGKFEILSIPLTSTLVIRKGDLVLCDGDRGKDLVYVLDPSLSLELAILINYLKKKLHAKSLNYFNEDPEHKKNSDGSFKGKISNTIQDLVNGLGILDEETQFQIPLKLVLRFANPQEVQNLKYKLVEEIKSLKTCILKISNNNDLQLRDNLIIKSSEYQFDEKKLIFYYYSKGGKRLDFRMLIKELFKIYKTRIWLCAILNPVPNTALDYDVDYTWINSININTIELENFPSDDFHVRNLQAIYHELIGTDPFSKGSNY